MTKENRKRYYLHAKLKGFVSLKAKQKTVYVTEKLMEELKAIHKKYMIMLRDDYSYNIQYTIPT